MRKYATIDEILNHFPSSVVLVGKGYGEDYNSITEQLGILGVKPQACYRPAYSPYPTGIVVSKDELQDIADRYYYHNNIYINNALKIYDKRKETKGR